MVIWCLHLTHLRIASPLSDWCPFELRLGRIQCLPALPKSQVQYACKISSGKNMANCNSHCYYYNIASKLLYQHCIRNCLCLLWKNKNAVTRLNFTFFVVDKSAFPEPKLWIVTFSEAASKNQPASRIKRNSIFLRGSGGVGNRQ